jgi:hypothetical protein
MIALYTDHRSFSGATCARSFGDSFIEPVGGLGDARARADAVEEPTIRPGSWDLLHGRRALPPARPSDTGLQEHGVSGP